VDAVDIDTDFATHQPFAYAQLSRPLVGRLEGTAGLRFDDYAYAKRSTLHPRLGLTYRVRGNLEWSGSFGRYSQLPPLVFMNAVPQNRDLAPILSTHWVTGLAYFPQPSLKLTLETYYKTYDRYPVSTEYPSVSFANVGELYDPAGFLFPLVSEGHGRAFGVELYVQKKLTKRLYGQMSYALSKVEHQALDGIWRRGGFDMPHVLSVIGGYRLGRFELSSKLTYTSGRPDTPLRPESLEQNRLILDVAHANELRAPAYHRLDIRADRRFTFKWGSLIAFVEAQNVYDRQNVRIRVWNPKIHAQDDIPQLRRLILGGVTLQL
jgi:outer membrane receptor protein involved in Fe transport